MFNGSEKSRLILASIFFLAIGWFSHFFYEGRNSTVGSVGQIRENSPEYKYTNPLLLINNSDLIYEKFNPLKNDVKKYIDAKTQNGLIKKASFYFRETNTGAWTGVNEDEPYTPSSMLKTAILITYLKDADENPGVLSSKYYYDVSKNGGENFPPTHLLQSGNYSVEALLWQAIVESDNAAAIALSLPKERDLVNLYRKLNLPIPPEKLNDFMSARAFSALFRTLYNSTYLSRESSERALELLSKTNFNKGIVSGTASGISVAHKFGEHTYYYSNDPDHPDYELHDCGIVYFPQKPYFICVMTKGANLTELETVIRDISKKTYDFVSSFKG